MLDNMSCHMFLFFVGPRIVKSFITYISLIWLVQLEKLFHVIIKTKWPAEKCGNFLERKHLIGNWILSLYMYIYIYLKLQVCTIFCASFISDRLRDICSFYLKVLVWKKLPVWCFHQPSSHHPGPICTSLSPSSQLVRSSGPFERATSLIPFPMVIHQAFGNCMKRHFYTMGSPSCSANSSYEIFVTPACLASKKATNNELIIGLQLKKIKKLVLVSFQHAGFRNHWASLLASWICKFSLNWFQLMESS